MNRHYAAFGTSQYKYGKVKKKMFDWAENYVGKKRGKELGIASRGVLRVLFLCVLQVDRP